MQSALDRGSRPMLSAQDFTAAPLNINDADLSTETPMSDIDPLNTTFTEMSFSLITYRAMICHRTLTEIGSKAATGQRSEATAASLKQSAVLTDFEHQVERIKDSCRDAPTAIQQFTIAVAEEMLVSMRLLLHRPLHSRKRNQSAECPPAARLNPMITATEVLERSQNKRAFLPFMKWAWYSWVKWYALAIVLAELCSDTETTPETERAWAAAQLSYDDYARKVADTRHGLLWKPIAKLMHRVKSMRSVQNVSAVAQDHSPSSADRLEGHVFSCSSEQTFTNSVSSQRPSSSQQHQLSEVNLEESSWLNWEMLIDDINMDDDLRFFADWL